MRKIFFLIFVFLFCRNAYAYKTVFSPFTGRLDYVGVQNASTDVLITSCSNGQILKYNGTTWDCGTDNTSAGGGSVNVSTDGAFVVSADTINFAQGLKTELFGTRVNVSFDPTEVINPTWGNGTQQTWTFDAGAVDPTIDFQSGAIKFAGSTDTTVIIGSPSSVAEGVVGVGPNLISSIPTGGDANALFEDTASSGSSSGGNIILGSHDGAANAQGDRLGTIGFGGQRTSGGTTRSVFVDSLTTSPWTNTSAAANLIIKTTPTGSTTAKNRLTVSSDNTIILGDGSDTDNFISSDIAGVTDPFLRFGNGMIGTNGNFTISGDQLFMATNTDRFVLMADGTSYKPEAINLGTDTTGNYAAGDAEAGNALTGDSATAFFSAGAIEVARGGTALGSISNDAVLVGNNGGTGFDQPALPNCADSGGNHLNYVASTGNFVCGTTGDGTGGAGSTNVSEDGVFVVSADTINFTTGIKATTGASGKATVSGDMATTTTPGIASFDSTVFSVGPFGGVTVGTLAVSKGGTGLNSVSNDAILVGNNAGTGYDQPALPSCSNATTSKLLYDNTTDSFSCGTDQTGAGGSTPTGTGFVHINNGVQDAVSRPVNIASQDVVNNFASFGITIDGGGSVITTGSKGFINVPYDMTLTKWILLSSVSGSVSLDITKTNFAGFPNSFASIDGTTISPRLRSEQSSQDSTLVGWTKNITSGDIVQVSVDSATTTTRVTAFFVGYRN